MKAAEAGPAPEVFRPPVSSVLALDFQQLKTKLQTYLRPEDVGRVEAATTSPPMPTPASSASAASPMSATRWRCVRWSPTGTSTRRR